jgi:hypothetical protein
MKNLIVNINTVNQPQPQDQDPSGLTNYVFTLS